MLSYINFSNIFYIKFIFNNFKTGRKLKNKYNVRKMGIGDWGLGIGPNPQSPIPIS
jgi:Na+/glutamate symporter